MEKCRECGSNRLSWYDKIINKSPVTDRRLRLNDVAVIFVLSCDDCSETVRVKTGEEVAEFMTEGLLNAI